MSDGTKSRTTGDLVIGALVVLLGIVILAHTYIATTVSLLFLGWLLFAGGVVTLAATLFRIGKDGFWVGALGGGLMTVLGLVFLRHTQAAAVTVTLVAGAMFLTTGIARLAAAFSMPEGRIPLLLTGGVSTVLGLIVLFNLVTASLTFLGLILGIETLSEGLAIMIVGRGSLGTSRAGQPSGVRPSTT
jgi:uncharacterized membrane protein HdeD (DUF308 family)